MLNRTVKLNRSIAKNVAKQGYPVVKNARPVILAEEIKFFFNIDKRFIEVLLPLLMFGTCIEVLFKLNGSLEIYWSLIGI